MCFTAFAVHYSFFLFFRGSQQPGSKTVNASNKWQLPQIASSAAVAAAAAVFTYL